MQAFGDSSTTNIPQKLEKFLTPPQTEDKYGQTTISISSQQSSSAHSEHNTPSYIESLKEERKLLSSHSELTHVFDLIDKEIKRLSNVEQAEIQAAAQASKDPSVLSKTLLVPVELYPNYNFVGRILGPRGTTAKQLETATGCKIIIHGRKAAGTNVTPTNEPLSIELTCSANLPDAAQKLEMGVSVIEALLVPPADGQDELKRQQLMILANMNGTYRPRSAAAIAAAAANSTASGVGDYQFENLLPFGYRLPTVSPNCHHEKMVKSLLSMGLPNSKPVAENTDCSNPRCAVFRNLLGNDATNQNGSLTKFEDVLNAMQLYEVINRIRISESSANFGRKLNVQRK